MNFLRSPGVVVITAAVLQAWLWIESVYPGITGLLGIINFISIAAFGISIFFKDSRHHRPACFYLLLGLGIGAVVGTRVCKRKLEESKILGDRIVVALENHLEQTGRLPERLIDLVPNFLQELPVTSQGLFTEHEFVYRTGSRRGEPNEASIAIPICLGGWSPRKGLRGEWKESSE